MEGFGTVFLDRGAPGDDRGYYRPSLEFTERTLVTTEARRTRRRQGEWANPDLPFSLSPVHSPAFLM